MNLKRVLCIIMCILFVLLSGCTDKHEDVDISSDTDISTTQADISEFLNKEYTPSDKLSSDIDSYQVQIYDTVFTFPIYYDELIADGWVLDEYEDSDEELDSYYERHINFKKGYVNVSFIMYNPDVTIRNIKDCVISGFSSFNLDYDYLDLPSPVFIPGGHQMDAAKLDEVLSGYREPDRKDVIESHTHIEYKKDDIFTCARLSFDENGIIYSYYTDNPVEPEGYTVSDAVHVENDYKKPTELGDEITDMTVIFDGDLYALPVPVSAFIDNGWQIVGESPTVSEGFYLLH